MITTPISTLQLRVPDFWASIPVRETRSIGGGGDGALLCCRALCAGVEWELMVSDDAVCHKGSVSTRDAVREELRLRRFR